MDKDVNPLIPLPLAPGAPATDRYEQDWPTVAYANDEEADSACWVISVRRHRDGLILIHGSLECLDQWDNDSVGMLVLPGGTVGEAVKAVSEALGAPEGMVEDCLDQLDGTPDHPK